MLVIGRKPCDDVNTPPSERRNEIVLTYLDVTIRIYMLRNKSGDMRRIGIDAPIDVKVVRGELIPNPAQEGRDAQDVT